MADLGEYEDKRVAIAGLGVEGRSALKFFRGRGALVTIVDEAESLAELPDGVEAFLGPESFESLDKFDIISRAPSIRPDRLPSGPQITSVTIEFFNRCPAPIIAVTGTKGKGTTTTLIAEILKNAGKTVHILGNIGAPGLDILDHISKDDVVCYEISSFQLWDLKKSPKVAVVLMVVEDHLDVHRSPEEYYEAKANIGRFQSSDDLVVVHPDNQNSAAIASKSPARMVRYLTEEGAHIRGDDIVISDQKICSVGEVGLIGRHNLENIAAAVTAAWEYTQDIPAIATAVKEFSGLEHRLEKVADIGGISYYDDSFSTTPTTTMAAINSFDQPIVLIIGGWDKGANFSEMADLIQKSNVKGVVVAGDTAPKILKALESVEYQGQVSSGQSGMTDMVSAAKDMATDGDIVLLSPGCASFGLFDNYKQRGNQFKDEVRKLED
ncbi:MAG: UDP-N-acetylmuramoyl-L-alanine--D-glutamate ligase [Candidatus Saccharimonadales bacterium]|nr:UDP-N-acetylmuramoyl-L-alanine--D-glutamate ligase [Candidatus Saccharimonadales bacterium]